MNKHTPGPWEACHDGKCKCRQVWSIPGDCPVFTANDKGEKVLVGLIHHEWGDDLDLIYGEIPAEQQEANARLIAAAPDLLEACKLVLENIAPKYSSYHICVEKLRAAISKAEGKEEEKK